MEWYTPMIDPGPAARLRAPRGRRVLPTDRHNGIRWGSQESIKEDAILDNVARCIGLLIVAGVVPRGPAGSASALGR